VSRAPRNLAWRERRPGSLSSPSTCTRREPPLFASISPAMYGNDNWINSYLDAIFDAGKGTEGANGGASAAKGRGGGFGDWPSLLLRERGHFSPPTTSSRRSSPGTKRRTSTNLASGTCSRHGSAPCPLLPGMCCSAEGGHALQKPGSPARRHPRPRGRGRGRPTGASSTATSPTFPHPLSPTFPHPLSRCLLPRTPPRGPGRSGSDGLARGAAGSGSTRETEARLAASAPHTRGGGAARRESSADSTPRATGKQ